MHDICPDNSEDYAYFLRRLSMHLYQIYRANKYADIPLDMRRGELLSHHACYIKKNSHYCTKHKHVERDY